LWYIIVILVNEIQLFNSSSGGGTIMSGTAGMFLSAEDTVIGSTTAVEEMPEN
jgi:hypothetical protein